MTGIIINKQSQEPGSEERNDWKQSYETKYSQYRDLQQPTIVDVNMNMDLFPETNSYHVAAKYKLVNKTNIAIDSMLLYFDRDMSWSDININNAKKLSEDQAFDHSWYRLKSRLQPGDSSEMEFSFSYHWSSFTGFKRFNAILQNGTFLKDQQFFSFVWLQCL